MQIDISKTILTGSLMHARVIGRDLGKIFITRCVKNKPNILAINWFLDKKYLFYVCVHARAHI